MFDKGEVDQNQLLKIRADLHDNIGNKIGIYAIAKMGRRRISFLSAKLLLSKAHQVAHSVVLQLHPVQARLQLLKQRRTPHQFDQLTYQARIVMSMQQV